MGDAVSLEDAQQLKMPYMNLCKVIVFILHRRLSVLLGG